MIQAKKWVKRAVALVVSASLSVATFAGEGYAGGSGDSTFGNASSGAGQAITTSESAMTGTKVSLVRIKKGSESTTDDDSTLWGGKVMGITPMGTAPGNTQGISETKGIMPIYFMVGDRRSSDMELLASGISGHSTTYASFKDYVVGTAYSYGITDPEEISAFQDLTKMRINWNGQTGAISDLIGIPQKAPSSMTDEQKKKIQTKFKVLAKILQKEYAGKGYDQMLAQFAKNGSYSVGDSGEYMFLVEPIYGLTMNGNRYGITPLQMAQIYSTSDIRQADRWTEIRSDVKKAVTNGYKKFNFIYQEWVGKYVDGRVTSTAGTGGTAYVARTYYNGPKGGGVNNFATSGDMKWGFGILVPSDFENSDGCADVLYGIVDVAGNDTFGSMDSSAGSNFIIMDGASSFQPPDDAVDWGALDDVVTMPSAALTLDMLSSAVAQGSYNSNNSTASGPLGILGGAIGKQTSQRIISDWYKSQINTMEASSKESTSGGGVPDGSSGIKLPKARELNGQSEIEKQVYAVVEDTQSTKSYVVINEELGQSYQDELEVVLTQGNVGVKFSEDYLERNSLSAVMWNKVVKEMGLQLKSVLYGTDYSDMADNLMFKDNYVNSSVENLAYGKGTYGSFTAYTIDHNKVNKTATDLYNYIASELKSEPFSEYYTGNTSASVKPVQDGGVIASMLTTSLGKKEELCNYMINEALSNERELVMEMNDDTIKKEGYGLAQYAIVGSGKEYSYRLATKGADGKLQWLSGNGVGSNGELQGFKGVISDLLVSDVLIPNGFKINGKTMNVESVVVKSPLVDNTEFLNKLSEDIAGGNSTTKANSIVEEGFEQLEVPIIDYNATANGESHSIKVGAREEDKESAESIGIVLILGETEPINVVKVYEKESGEHETTNCTEISNTAIDIKNEDQYEVVEWFTGFDKPEVVATTDDWDKLSEFRVDKSATGEGEGSVDLSQLPTDDEKGTQDVIYIRYKGEPQEQEAKGGTILPSKYVSQQKDLKDFGSGPLDISTSLSSFGFGCHTWYCSGCECDCSSDSDCSGDCYCPGHPCYDTGWIDPSYSVLAENTAGLDKKVVAPDSGIYKFDYTNNKKSGSLTPNPTLENFNIKVVTHRGYDVVTLAKYKEDVNGNAVSDLSKINYPNANTPQGVRSTSEYSKPVNYTIELVGTKLIVTKSCKAGCVHEAELSANQAIDNELLVKVLRGKKNEGVQEAKALPNTSAKMNGVEIKHLKGTAAPRGNVSYYPYVRMLYETIDNEDTQVFILSDEESVFKPNDYIEAGWTSTKEKDTIDVVSNQWSTHAKANSNSEWRQKNRVLPGGAIFGVENDPTNVTTIGITTYQNYVQDDLLAKVGAQYNMNWMKLADKVPVHEAAVKELVDQLEKTKIEMRGNTNWNGELDLNSGGVILKQGGSFNSRTLSNDTKYWLQDDVNGKNTKNTESDLDVRNQKTTTTYYRIKGDVYGVVYLQKSTDNNNWNTMQTWKAGISADTAVAGLSDEAKELNDRTLIVTNFMNSLDRNMEWYNEAWDGFCVVKQETTFEYGLFNPVKRQAVLDPQITPKLQNRADMFTSAHAFGFMIEERTFNIPFVNGTSLAYDTKDIHRSEKYYAPNVTVQDIFQ